MLFVGAQGIFRGESLKMRPHAPFFMQVRSNNWVPSTTVTLDGPPNELTIPPFCKVN